MERRWKTWASMAFLGNLYALFPIESTDLLILPIPGIQQLKSTMLVVEYGTVGYTFTVQEYG